MSKFRSMAVIASGGAKKKPLSYRIGLQGEAIKSWNDLPDSDLDEWNEVLLDGSFLEGGGQILRMATALAVAGQKKLHINKVRANRSRGGLQPQHLAGVELVAAISGGQLKGANLNSSELRFYPGKPIGGQFYASPNTAGSTTLLIQAILPCLLLAQGSSFPSESSSFPSPPSPTPPSPFLPFPSSASPSSSPSEIVVSENSKSVVRLVGGTNNPHAPPIDYVLHILFPTLNKHFGIDISVDLIKRGFYPYGQGELLLTMGGKAKDSPSMLPPLTLVDRGHVTSIHGRAFISGKLPYRIAEILLDSANKVVRSHLRRLSDDNKDKHAVVRMEAFQESQETAYGTGAGIFLVANTSTGCKLAGSRLLEKGQMAKDVGGEAAEELIHQLEAFGCVDEYLQDQLIIFMAMASGTSRLLLGEPTLHTRTAIWVAEKLTKARFRLVPPTQEGEREKEREKGERGKAGKEGEEAEELGRDKGVEVSKSIAGEVETGEEENLVKDSKATEVESVYSLSVQNGAQRLRGKPWLLECYGAGISSINC